MSGNRAKLDRLSSARNHPDQFLDAVFAASSASIRSAFSTQASSIKSSTRMSSFSAIWKSRFGPGSSKSTNAQPSMIPSSLRTTAIQRCQTIDDYSLASPEVKLIVSSSKLGNCVRLKSPALCFISCPAPPNRLLPQSEDPHPTTSSSKPSPRSTPKYAPRSLALLSTSRTRS